MLEPIHSGLEWTYSKRVTIRLAQLKTLFCAKEAIAPMHHCQACQELKLVESYLDRLNNARHMPCIQVYLLIKYACPAFK